MRIRIRNPGTNYLETWFAISLGPFLIITLAVRALCIIATLPWTLWGRTGSISDCILGNPKKKIYNIQCTNGKTIVHVPQNVGYACDLYTATRVNKGMKRGSGFSECRLRYRVVHSNNSKYADEKRFLTMYLPVHTCSGFSECRLRYRVAHSNNS